MFENIVMAFVMAFVPFFGFTWFYLAARKYKKEFIKADCENFTLRMEIQCLRSEMALIREYTQDRKEAVK